MREERNLVTEICSQINRDIGFSHGFRLEPLLWEEDVNSDVSDRSQQVINKQISSYDIYLGIMGSYFGRSTGAYASGTEEEFRIAIGMHDAGSVKSVQFYFSDTLVAPSEIDVGELEKVRNFKNIVGSSGVFYKSYKDLTQFSIACRRGLTRACHSIIEERKAKGEEKPTSRISRQRPYENLRHLKGAFDADPFVSSHVLTVEAVKDFEEFTKFLTDVGKRVSELTRSFEKATKEIERYNSGKSQNHNRVLKIIDKALSTMEDFIHFFSHSIPPMDSLFTSAMSSFQRVSLIIHSTSDMEKDGISASIHAAKRTIEDFNSLKVASLDASAQILDAFSEGDRLIGSARTFRAITLDFADLLDRAIESINQLEDEKLA